MRSTNFLKNGGDFVSSEEVKDRELNQIALTISEEIEKIEEEQLTEQERTAIRYIRKKIKNLDEFGQFAKLVHFYHKYYGLGSIEKIYAIVNGKMFNIEEGSFTIVDRASVTALTFNVKEKSDTVLYRVSLDLLKPLSRFLDKLLLNIHIPTDAIKEILKKYMSEESANRALLEIKEKLIFPVSIKPESSDDIVMLIAPRVIG
jgi:hypothetical protein